MTTTTTAVDVGLRARFLAGLDLALANARPEHVGTESHGDAVNRWTATRGQRFRTDFSLTDFPGGRQHGWLRVTRLADNRTATMTAEANGITTFDNDLADEMSGAGFFIDQLELLAERVDVTYRATDGE